MGLEVIPRAVIAAEPITEGVYGPAESPPRTIDYGPDLEREDWTMAAAALCLLMVAFLAALAQVIGWVRA